MQEEGIGYMAEYRACKYQQNKPWHHSPEGAGITLTTQHY